METPHRRLASNTALSCWWNGSANHQATHNSQLSKVLDMKTSSFPLVFIHFLPFTSSPATFSQHFFSTFIARQRPLNKNALPFVILMIANKSKWSSKNTNFKTKTHKCDIKAQAACQNDFFPRCMNTFCPNLPTLSSTNSCEEATHHHSLCHTLPYSGWHFHLLTLKRKVGFYLKKSVRRHIPFVWNLPIWY